MKKVSTQLNKAAKRHQAGDIEAASELYHKILKKDPDHHCALYLLGLACHQAGQFEDASRLIQRAIVLDPNEAIYYNSWGIVVNGRKKP
jgi:Flp pilus assembly protein TadD